MTQKIHYVVVAVLLIALLCVALLIIYQRTTSSRKRPRSSKPVTITNDTSEITNIKLHDRHISIEPDQSIRIILNKEETIACNNHRYIFSNPKVKELIIGEDGIETDINATKNTRIVNESSENMVFRYEDKFRKLRSIYLPKNSVVRGPIIRKGQKWNIEGVDEIVRDKLRVEKVPTRKILWNGVKLR